MSNKNIRFLNNSTLNKIKNRSFTDKDYNNNVESNNFLHKLSVLLRVINTQLEMKAMNGLEKSWFGMGTKKANITNRLLKVQNIIETAKKLGMNVSNEKSIKPIVTLSDDEKSNKFMYKNILYILISAIGYRNDYQLKSNDVIDIADIINNNVVLDDMYSKKNTGLINNNNNKISGTDLLALLMNIIDVVIGRGASTFGKQWGVTGNVKTKVGYNDDVPDYNSDPLGYIIYMFAFIYDRWMNKKNIDDVKKYIAYAFNNPELSNQDLYNHVDKELTEELEQYIKETGEYIEKGVQDTGKYLQNRYSNTAEYVKSYSQPKEQIVGNVTLRNNRPRNNGPNVPRNN